MSAWSLAAESTKQACLRVTFIVSLLFRVIFIVAQVYERF